MSYFVRLCTNVGVLCRSKQVGVTTYSCETNRIRTLAAYVK